MNKNVVLSIVVAVIFAAGGFFGGMYYQKSQRAVGQFGGVGQFGRRMMGAYGQGANRGNAILGQIISSDAKSVTVKLSDGSSKIVVLSAATVINKQATGSASDLKTGETVSVFGQANADGSVTATNVQLRPAMMKGQPVNR